MKVDFTPGERRVIDAAFQKYAAALDIVSQIMTADGRLPANSIMGVADDRSGFVIQEAPVPMHRVNGSPAPEIEAIKE